MSCTLEYGKGKCLKSHKPEKDSYNKITIPASVVITYDNTLELRTLSEPHGILVV